MKSAAVVILAGALRHLFSNELQSSGCVGWWAADVNLAKAIVPKGELVLLCAKKNLAQNHQLRSFASGFGAEFREFDKESEMFQELTSITGIQADPSKPKLGPHLVRSVNLASNLQLKDARVLEVPVARIRRDEGQPRKFFNKERLEALGRSLAAAGQEVPAIVIPVDNDPAHDYMLYDGERRWRAAQLIGKETLLIIVAKTMSDAQRFKGSAICNFGREGHHPLEIALALRQIKESDGSTHQQLADQFSSHSVSWVTQHLSLLQLHPEVQRMLNPELPEEEQLSLSAVLEVVKLPQNHQLQAARHILQHGMKLGRVRDYIGRLIAEVGTSSLRRERKPGDEYKLWRTFTTYVGERTDHFLRLPNAQTVGTVFQNRSWEDREAAVQKLDELVAGLEQLKTLIKKLDEENEHVTAFPPHSVRTVTRRHRAS